MLVPAPASLPPPGGPLFILAIPYSHRCTLEYGSNNSDELNGGTDM